MKRYDFTHLGRGQYGIYDRRAPRGEYLATSQDARDAEEIVTALNAWHEARVFVRAGLPVG